MRVSRVERRYAEATVYKRYPSFYGEAAYVMGAGAALMLALDMNEKGFTEHAKLAAASAGAILGTYLLTKIVGRTVHRTKTHNSAEMVTKTEPVPLQVLDGSRTVANLSPGDDGLVSFRLPNHLPALGGEPRDMTLIAGMQGADTIRRTFRVTQGVFEAAVEQHRAEVERQARELREQRLAQERAEREERERKERAAAAVRAQLDRAVASLSDWDRAHLVTRFMYADAGFQLLVVERCSESYGIRSYGDFLNLPLRSQVDIIRQLARLGGGDGYGASMFLQSLLNLPAYLAEEILR